MYTKEEASMARQKFWISFGKYMAPILSADQNKINWINYRTGVKSIAFKMDATYNFAYVGIEIQAKDQELRKIYFDQFLAMKSILEEYLPGEWYWHSDTTNESGNRVARIFTRLEQVNVFRESDWPAIISFLKERIMNVDKFWCEYHELFKTLC